MSCAMVGQSTVPVLVSRSVMDESATIGDLYYDTTTIVQ